MLAGPAQGSQGPSNNNTNSNPPAGANAWGPAGNNEENAAGEENFEPGNFRTGFTPGTGTGFTPGYSALLNSNFPMPSPNTAAFLNSITNVDNAADADANNGPTAPANNFANGEPRQPPSAIPPHLQHQPHGMSHLNPAHNAGGAGPAGPNEPTITPNTLSALTGAVANELSRQGQAPPNGMPNAFYPPGPVPGAPGAPLPPPGMGGPVDYAQQNANAASQAANGLFLLSQAHQELSKREEEAKSSSNTPVMSKRNISNAGPKPPAAGQKRKDTGGSKGGAAKKGKKQQQEEKDMESSSDGEQHAKPSGGRGETEEEKRKNFLERNRQAALKCRQRKKAWLNELQNKVETLSVENERLQGHCRQLEDELQRMSSILVQHRDCGVGMPQMAPAYGRPLR